MATDQPRINSLYAAQPHHHSVWFVGGNCLAVRNIFLLCFQQDGHRLVFKVRLGNVFGRSGGHLQARPFLSERTGNGAQRRTRIGAERNRASPQPAQILCSPFVLRLSDRHRRYRGLGLRGRTAPTDFSVKGNSRPTVTCIISKEPKSAHEFVVKLSGGLLTNRETSCCTNPSTWSGHSNCWCNGSAA